jgi:hypothetical protein
MSLSRPIQWYHSHAGRSNLAEWYLYAKKIIVKYTGKQKILFYRKKKIYLGQIYVIVKLRVFKNNLIEKYYAGLENNKFYSRLTMLLINFTNYYFVMFLKG